MFSAVEAADCGYGAVRHRRREGVPALVRISGGGSSLDGINRAKNVESVEVQAEGANICKGKEAKR